MFLIKSIKTGLIDCLDHAGNGIRSAGIHVHPNNALNAQMKNLDAAAADFKFLPIGGQGSVYDTKIKRNKGHYQTHNHIINDNNCPFP